MTIGKTIGSGSKLAHLGHSKLFARFSSDFVPKLGQGGVARGCEILFFYFYRNLVNVMSESVEFILA